MHLNRWIRNVFLFLFVPISPLQETNFLLLIFHFQFCRNWEIVFVMKRSLSKKNEMKKNRLHSFARNSTLSRFDRLIAFNCMKEIYYFFRLPFIPTSDSEDLINRKCYSTNNGGDGASDSTLLLLFEWILIISFAFLFFCLEKQFE